MYTYIITGQTSKRRAREKTNKQRNEEAKIRKKKENINLIAFITIWANWLSDYKNTDSTVLYKLIIIIRRERERERERKILTDSHIKTTLKANNSLGYNHCLQYNMM